jgi:Domain of unknown function (DUF1839)
MLCGANDMLARAHRAVFADLTPATFVRHDLHAGSRDWPQTNCYTDLWIGILNALGRTPAAGLGFTCAQDFEGDQFTFFKFPLEDLESLFGVSVQELAIYDTLEAHAIEQIERGRLVLVEVDGFYLPDTQGTSYRTEHTKTTIGINRLDPSASRMDYFHNDGFFSLAGEDYLGVLRKTPEFAARPDLLFPYVEFAKFDGQTLQGAELATAARAILRKHLTRRPRQNPVAAFRARIVEQAQAAAQRAPCYFHLFAFNTLRQLGANFELLGSHLSWLAQQGDSGLDSKIAACAKLSAGAKSFQFQLARAFNRKRFVDLESQIEPLVGLYDEAIGGLAELYRI